MSLSNPNEPFEPTGRIVSLLSGLAAISPQTVRNAYRGMAIFPATREVLGRAAQALGVPSPPYPARTHTSLSAPTLTREKPQWR